MSNDKQYLNNTFECLNKQLFNNNCMIKEYQNEINEINQYLEYELHQNVFYVNNEFYLHNYSNYYNNINDEYMINQCYNNILYIQNFRHKNEMSINLGYSKIESLQNYIDYYYEENVLINNKIIYKKLSYEISSYIQDKKKYRNIFNNILIEIKKLSVENFIKNIVVQIIKNSKKIGKSNKFKNRKNFNIVLKNLISHFESKKIAQQNIKIIKKSQESIVNFPVKKSETKKKIKKKKKKKKKKKYFDKETFYLDEQIKYRESVKFRYNSIIKKLHKLNTNNSYYSEDNYYNIDIKIPYDFWLPYKLNNINFNPLLDIKEKKITFIDYECLIKKTNAKFIKKDNSKNVIVIIGKYDYVNKDIKESPHIIFKIPDIVVNVVPKDGQSMIIDDTSDFLVNNIFKFTIKLAVDLKKLNNSKLENTLKNIQNNNMDNTELFSKNEKLESINFEERINICENNLNEVNKFNYYNLKNLDYLKEKIGKLKNTFKANQILKKTKISNNKFFKLVNKLETELNDVHNYLLPIPKYFKTTILFLEKIVSLQFYNDKIIESIKINVYNLKIKKNNFDIRNSSKKLSEIMYMCSHLNQKIKDINIFHDNMLILKKIKEIILLLITFIKAHKTKLFSFIINLLKNIFNNIFFNNNFYIDNQKRIEEIVNNKEISNNKEIYANKETNNESVLIYIEILFTDLILRLSILYKEVILNGSKKLNKEKYKYIKFSKLGEKNLKDSKKQIYESWFNVCKYKKINRNLNQIFPDYIYKLLLE